MAFAGSPPSQAGNALSPSDLHFDPLADPSLVKRLIDAPVSDWETIFSSSKQTGYAMHPEDANYLTHTFLLQTLNQKICYGML